MDSPPAATTVAVDPRLVSYTHLMYALHAASIGVGILGTAVVVKAFVFGVPSIIAIVMNYSRRARVRDTWLNSHFRWQRRTFWIALAALVAAKLYFGPFALIMISSPLGASYALIGIWVTWRICRGWLALKEGRSMPSTIL